jgi:hypothetical protein
MNPRVELHMAFESISSEKKNMVNLALKTAIVLFTTFVQTEKTLE